MNPINVHIALIFIYSMFLGALIVAGAHFVSDKAKIATLAIIALLLYGLFHERQIIEQMYADALKVGQ